MNIKSIFSNFFKGEQGESEVSETIANILKTKGDENYYLVPKATLDDVAGSSREIDLLLLHPVLGIYVIEVKNWQSLKYLNDQNNPFEQADVYKRMLMEKIQNKLKKLPVNVEYRVIFPSIYSADTKEFYTKNPNFKNYQNHTFFKDDIASSDIFARFFNSSATFLPNKKDFLAIAELVISQNKIKQQKIIPIITKDEVLFFDHKQLSIMNGYTGGFRIIRGVAGTGKTMILANFVANRLERDESEKFLILCFNKKLRDSIEASFGEKFSKQNIAVYSIISLLKRIGFDDAKLGIDEKMSLDRRYKIYESNEAMAEFRLKFRTHLAKHPIDYVLCDETQDMPAGFMRIVYEEINDCVFFIDEAQKFYSYTMNSITDIFHHPNFTKIDMRGRVKNLKNVYRTPSNIAKCAFEILENDRSINEYYKRSFYLNSGFIQDINCVLEDGNIYVQNLDDFNDLKQFLQSLPNDEIVAVLGYSAKSVEAINTMISKEISNKNIYATTIQSIKGLEAQTVVIHNFLPFLMTIYNNEHEIFYRKIYVLLTRSRENLYISLPKHIDENLPNEVKNVLTLIEKYTKQSTIINTAQTTSQTQVTETVQANKIKLASIKPVLHNIKEGSEFIVAASEIFAIITGIFA